jgi:hypothetical protein
MQVENWDELCEYLSDKFGSEVDLNGVLFLVGVRERGLVPQQFSKEEKLSLMNLGSCILLKRMGLVDETGTDDDGWPVFKQKALVPEVSEARKKKTLQDCALQYFKEVFGGN